MILSRRNFLGVAAVAPLVFVPKLITGVSWGIRKPGGWPVEFWVGRGALYEWAPNSDYGQQMKAWYEEQNERHRRNKILFGGIKTMNLPPGSGEIKFEPAKI